MDAARVDTSKEGMNRLRYEMSHVRELRAALRDLRALQDRRAEEVASEATTGGGEKVETSVRPDEPMATVDQLFALSAHPKFVGIGETGLDYHYTADSAAQQAESRRVHIEAARRTGLPLIIHSRDADDDMARILVDEHRAGAFSCVMHCFTSGAALAQTALDLGFYLSMSGIAAFPRSGDIRAIFAAAPLDRILVETDAPYLAPPPHRGKRNEPAYVAHTARVGAELYGLTLAEFAAATSANFDRLFARAAG